MDAWLADASTREVPLTLAAVPLGGRLYHLTSNRGHERRRGTRHRPAIRAMCDIFLRMFFRSRAKLVVEATMANTLAIMLKPIRWGWAVQLTDGRLLARFWGPRAHARALQYVARSGDFAAPA